MSHDNQLNDAQLVNAYDGLRTFFSIVNSFVNHKFDDSYCVSPFHSRRQREDYLGKMDRYADETGRSKKNYEYGEPFTLMRLDYSSEDMYPERGESVKDMKYDDIVRLMQNELVMYAHDKGLDEACISHLTPENISSSRTFRWIMRYLVGDDMFLRIYHFDGKTNWRFDTERYLESISPVYSRLIDELVSIGMDSEPKSKVYHGDDDFFDILDSIESMVKASYDPYSNTEEMLEYFQKVQDNSADLSIGSILRVFNQDYMSDEFYHTNSNDMFNGYAMSSDFEILVRAALRDSGKGESFPSLGESSFLGTIARIFSGYFWEKRRFNNIPESEVKSSPSLSEEDVYSILFHDIASVKGWDSAPPHIADPLDDVLQSKISSLQREVSAKKYHDRHFGKC